MLKTILSISGKPGLYKLVSQGKNMLIVESLADKKRFPAYGNEKIISLGDIAMYTDTEDVPLKEVFLSMKKKENGAAVVMDLKKATADDLRAYESFLFFQCFGIGNYKHTVFAAILRNDIHLIVCNEQVF